MDKWEYYWTEAPKIHEINTLGEKGWEAVLRKGDWYLFKRKLE